MRQMLGALLLGSALLPACTKPPACEVAAGQQPDPAANAGCLIQENGKLLVVRQRGSGKLNIPAGTRSSNESAQCTAHRETWEETGFSVRVGPLARAFDNGFRLYHCEIIAEGAQPFAGKREVSEVLWATTAEINSDNWRYPEQAAVIQALTQTQ